MKQAGKTLHRQKAGLPWLPWLMNVEWPLEEEVWLWCRIQQKQSSLVARSSWDIKLKPSKARLSFTNNIGTQAQKAMPMTRKGISWA